MSTVSLKKQKSRKILPSAGYCQRKYCRCNSPNIKLRKWVYKKRKLDG